MFEVSMHMFYSDGTELLGNNKIATDSQIVRVAHTMKISKIQDQPISVIPTDWTSIKKDINTKEKIPEIILKPN